MLSALFVVLAIDWHDPNAVASAAVTNHPTLARLEAEVVAARERVGSAAALPNPMLMGGVQDKQVDFTDDEMMTMYMVGAEQTITRPSRRDAIRAAAELEARVAGQQIASARAEIEREAIFAWYDAAAADSKIAAARDVRQLVSGIIDSARVRYEVGRAVQAEVIRAQLELSNLDHEILGLEGERAAALARLLPLLGLSAATDVPRLHLAHGTAAREVGAATVPPQHPALAALATEIERQEKNIEIARLLGKPDVTIEASYGYRRTQTDMFSVLATIELPIRRNAIVEPRLREATALRDAARLRLDELRRGLARAIAIAAAAHDQANQQLRLHEAVLVPQARLAFDSTLASYQTGATSFDSVLGSETAYLRLQLDYYDYLAAHIKAIADFEAIQKGATSSAIGSPAPAVARGVSATAAPAMGGM